MPDEQNHKDAEVEEQGRRWPREDEENTEQDRKDEKPDDSDEGNDVDEQGFKWSDANMKRSVAPIEAPLSILG